MILARLPWHSAKGINVAAPARVQDALEVRELGPHRGDLSLALFECAAQPLIFQLEMQISWVRLRRGVGRLRQCCRAANWNGIGEA